MFQIKQTLAGGVPELTSVPAARAGVQSLRIQTRTSLISLGTERMLLEFGKANYIEKVRQHPDKVRMAFDKIRTDGFFAALDSVRSKLDQPIALGYCNAGVVLDTGGGVRSFRSGQRVVSSGPHAEVVCVSKNLCAGIPKELPDRTAAFTAVGAIALQGIRLVQPTLGEAVVVTGLGLIGLIAVQLLRAHGCRVLGIDFDPQKLRLAQAFGAETVDLSAGENPVLCADRFSRGAASMPFSSPRPPGATNPFTKRRLCAGNEAGLYSLAWRDSNFRATTSTKRNFRFRFPVPMDQAGMTQLTKRTAMITLFHTSAGRRNGTLKR